MQKLDRCFHIKCVNGDVGRYCFLVGDPARCDSFKKHLTDPYELTYNREFRIVNGELEGRKVTVCSTGIGAPSTAIAVEELCDVGADTFIRCGTCGGIDLSVKSGDIVVATGAVRFEHTTAEYAPIEYPAVPAFEITDAICRSAKDLGFSYHAGIVHCKDSFYGQHRPESMPVSYDLVCKWEAWKRLGVLASEMESSALFVIGDYRRCRTGACFLAVWNQERDKAGFEQTMDVNVENVVAVSVEAMKKIIIADKNKQL